MSEAPEERRALSLDFCSASSEWKLLLIRWARAPPPQSRAWGRSGGGTSRGPRGGGAGERDQLPEASVSGQDPEKQGSEGLLGVVTRQRPPVPVPQ